MRPFGLAMVVLSILFAGCGGEPEPEPPPKPVQRELPKKSADQLYNEATQQINPLLREGPPHEAEITAIMNDLKTKYRPPTEANGPEALGRIKSMLTDRARTANELRKWNILLTSATGLELLAAGPPRAEGELKKLRRYKEHAHAELSKPKIKVKGFFDDYVALEIYLPTTQTTVSEYVREGDSFLPDPENPAQNLLRLDRVIGNNKAVRIYYYKTDSSWEVPGPSA